MSKTKGKKMEEKKIREEIIEICTTGLQKGQYGRKVLYTRHLKHDFKIKDHDSLITIFNNALTEYGIAGFRKIKKIYLNRKSLVKNIENKETIQKHHQDWLDMNIS